MRRRWLRWILRLVCWFLLLLLRSCFHTVQLWFVYWPRRAARRALLCAQLRSVAASAALCGSSCQAIIARPCARAQQPPFARQPGAGSCLVCSAARRGGRLRAPWPNAPTTNSRPGCAPRCAANGSCAVLQMAAQRRTSSSAHKLAPPPVLAAPQRLGAACRQHRGCHPTPHPGRSLLGQPSTLLAPPPTPACSAAGPEADGQQGRACGPHPAAPGGAMRGANPLGS